MQKRIINLIIGLLTAAGITAGAQNRPAEYLGLPGDNLNLYAVMQLFQESETLESFERNLNAENSRVNNLDLNGDNLIDYITVNDFPDGNVHTIVLRVALNQNESQDVAVFTVERFRDGSAQIQLIGDEDLYGRNYIIEPNYGDGYGETPNPGYTGRPVNRERRVTIEVAAWPLISYMYMPDYITWRSRWYWGYWPAYWHAWRPYYWDYYYGYHSNWYPHCYSNFRHWHTPRIAYYHNHYYSDMRVHSQQVRNRISEGRYRDTYSRPELKREGMAAGARSRVDGATSRGNSAGARSRLDGASSRGNTKSALRSSAGVQDGTSRRSSSSAVQRSGNSNMKDNGSNARGATQSTGVSRRSSDPASVRNSAQAGGSARVASPSGQTKSASQRQAGVSSQRTTSRSSQGQVNNTSRKSTTSGSARVSSPSGQTKSASQRQTGVSSQRTTSRPAQGQVNNTSRKSSPSGSARVSSPSGQSRSASQRQAGISSRSSSTKSASVSQRSSSGSSGRISSGHSSPSRGSSAGSSSRGGGGSSGGGSRGGSGSSSRR